MLLGKGEIHTSAVNSDTGTLNGSLAAYASLQNNFLESHDRNKTNENNEEDKNDVQTH